LGEDEVYVVFRGRDLAIVADALGIIVSANAALSDYAADRRRHMASV
jgi:hypothetical protein